GGWEDGVGGLRGGGGGEEGPERGRGPGRVRHHDRVDPTHPSRSAARAGGDHGGALAGAAGHPDRRCVIPGYEASSWFGIAAPKDTPAAIVDHLHRETNAGLADPKIMERLADMGGMVLAGSPADFRRLIADETAKWAKVIKVPGLKPP